MKVVIASNSGIVTDRLAAMLSELDGVEVAARIRHAGDVVPAVDSLRPDAVILDVRMAGGNGIEVLRELKSARSSLLVLMLSDNPALSYRQKCFDLRADYYLDKAAEFEKVIGIVRAADVAQASSLHPKEPDVAQASSLHPEELDDSEEEKNENAGKMPALQPTADVAQASSLHPAEKDSMS